VKNPLFSIITVTYNAEKVVERTLKSVAGQTYPNTEHIIIDGASKDKTLALIQNSRFKAQKFICASEPDKGLYDAMNKGLQRATGDYVWFLNAGDKLLSDTTIEEVVGHISQVDELPDIIYGETNLVSDAGKFLAHRRLKAPRRLTWRSFKMGMLVCHQSFVVKRSIAPDYDLHYRLAADFDWCIRCLKNSKNIFNTHLVLSDFLIEGLSSQKRKASLRERFRIMSRYYGVIPTALRHVWFALRFFTAKLLGRQI
jgi:glycosyltransferase involved in cell wall biosynthesis